MGIFLNSHLLLYFDCGIKCVCFNRAGVEQLYSMTELFFLKVYSGFKTLKKAITYLIVAKIIIYGNNQWWIIARKHHCNDWTDKCPFVLFIASETESVADEQHKELTLYNETILCYAARVCVCVLKCMN